MAAPLTRPVRVVGFIGKAGSGKTTAAKYMVYDKFNYHRLRFADGLKRMLISGLGIDKDYIDGELKNLPCPELCNVTGRHAMIALGTEWGRDLIHPDLWVNALSRDMLTCIKMTIDRFVIDDVRFLNEANWIKGLNEKGINAKLIRILRDTGEKSIDHRSETEQDAIEVDWEIWNNGTLDSFYKSVDETIQLMFRKE